MARLCERPGCSAPASFAYGFDAARTLVWLATLDPDSGARAGRLCRRHAEALSPPRGWWLDDRRQIRPRLFAVADDAGPELAAGGAVHVADEAPADERTPSSHPTPPAAADDTPARKRRPRPRDHTAELPLLLVPEVAVPSSEVPDAPDFGDDVTSRPRTDTTADEPPTAGPIAPAVDPDETQAMPWTPAFDRHDDLGGTLAARSPLLSRAFGVVSPATEP